MAKKEEKPKVRPTCPICGSQMRKPFEHFYWSHSKWDLAKLLVKLLKSGDHVHG